MQKGAVLIIGDELMEGSSQDANGSVLADTLTRSGIKVATFQILDDNIETLANTISGLTDNHDVILISGGIGSTHDDVTRQALKKVAPAKDEFNTEVFQKIEQIISSKKGKLTEQHKQLCYIPGNCTPLENPTGIAPPLMYDFKATKIFALPGVPSETKEIAGKIVAPLLQKNSKAGNLEKRIKTAGIPESIISEKLDQVLNEFPGHIKAGYLPDMAEVTIRLRSTNAKSSSPENELNAIVAKVKEQLGHAVYGEDNDTLAYATGEKLKSLGKSLTIAESCTGGYISHLITAVPGSSSWFDGSIIAYSYALKKKILNVKNDTLQEKGAVSEEVVKEMLYGSIDMTGSDYAISVSGIAGPGGGTPEKPVGTVWIAAGNKTKCKTRKLQLHYQRLQNIRYASATALNMLRLQLFE